MQHLCSVSKKNSALIFATTRGICFSFPSLRFRRVSRKTRPRDSTAFKKFMLKNLAWCELALKRNLLLFHKYFSLLPLPPSTHPLTARVLANSGAEGLPRGGALWEGGHKHTWKRLPRGQVRALLKVRAFLSSVPFGPESLSSFLYSSPLTDPVGNCTETQSQVSSLCVYRQRL